MITYTMNETEHRIILTPAVYMVDYCDAMKTNNVNTHDFDRLARGKIYLAQYWSLAKIVEHYAMLKSGALCGEI